MKTLGLVVARGNSKSIPKKNIIELCGKPLIAWTIEGARRAKKIDRLVLSTDNTEIAEIGKRYGAEVLFMRPAELALDLTPDLPVFEHALQWFIENEGKAPEYVVHLRPTGPLRSPADIDKAVELIESDKTADSVRAISPAPVHPLKTYRLENDHLVPFISGELFGIKEPFNMPRQLLPKAYVAKGYLSVIRARTILEKKSMTGDIILPLLFDPFRAVDIDSLEDLELARRRLEKLIDTNAC